MKDEGKISGETTKELHVTPLAQKNIVHKISSYVGITDKLKMRLVNKAWARFLWPSQFAEVMTLLGNQPESYQLLLKCSKLPTILSDLAMNNISERLALIVTAVFINKINKIDGYLLKYSSNKVSLDILKPWFVNPQTSAPTIGKIEELISQDHHQLIYCLALASTNLGIAKNAKLKIDNIIKSISIVPGTSKLTQFLIENWLSNQSNNFGLLSTCFAKDILWKDDGAYVDITPTLRKVMLTIRICEDAIAPIFFSPQDLDIHALIFYAKDLDILELNKKAITAYLNQKQSIAACLLVSPEKPGSLDLYTESIHKKDKENLDKILISLKKISCLVAIAIANEIPLANDTTAIVNYLGTIIEKNNLFAKGSNKKNRQTIESEKIIKELWPKFSFSRTDREEFMDMVPSIDFKQLGLELIGIALINCSPEEIKTADQLMKIFNEAKNINSLELVQLFKCSCLKQEDLIEQQTQKLSDTGEKTLVAIFAKLIPEQKIIAILSLLKQCENNQAIHSFCADIFVQSGMSILSFAELLIIKTLVQGISLRKDANVQVTAIVKKILEILKGDNQSTVKQANAWLEALIDCSGIPSNFFEPIKIENLFASPEQNKFSNNPIISGNTLISYPEIRKMKLIEEIAENVSPRGGTFLCLLYYRVTIKKEIEEQQLGVNNFLNGWYHKDQVQGKTQKRDLIENCLNAYRKGEIYEPANENEQKAAKDGVCEELYLLIEKTLPKNHSIDEQNNNNENTSKKNID